MTAKTKQKPTCAVSGMIRPGAMCGQIIVGLKHCGYSGKCEHQRAPSSGLPKEKA